MKNIEETLEFNKIKNKLSSFAYSDDAKDMCINLHKFDNKLELENSLNETDSAFQYLNENYYPEFNNLKNIDNALARLTKEAPLNIIELINISTILSLSEKLIKFKNYTVKNNNLIKYFDKLKTLINENNNIKKVIINENEISDYSSLMLKELRRKKIILNEKLKLTAKKLLSKYADYLQEPVIANKDGAYCLPIKSEFKNRVDGTIRSISSTQFTIFIEPKEIMSINNEIIENEALEQIEIEKILFELSTLLFPYVEEIKNNYDTLVKLDFIFAKAKYAKFLNATLPLLNDDGIIELINARHPLIPSENVVPLNINIGENYYSLIITGPNTGGKTVSLKTVGIIELMALSGLFIPALDNSKIAFFDNIFADIGDEQSIEQNLSTFSSHMKNIIEILKLSTNKSLVLFDELCTGTDPIEGATLAISILNKLLNIKTRVIATTHYPELKRYALTKEYVKNGSFEFNVDTLKPTYKLIIGIPGKSNAFAISEKLGLDKSIIEDAKNLLDNDDIHIEDVLSSIEESKKKIDKDKLEIEEYKKEIEELKNKIKRQEKGLNDRAGSIIRKAKEEATDILYTSKKIADETLKNIKNSKNSEYLMQERTKINKELNKISDSLIEKTKGPAKPLSPKKIKLGATVKVLSLNMQGIVESLPDKNYNLFVRIGIMRANVNLRDLELICEETVKIDGTKIKRTVDKNGISKIKLEKSYIVSPEINLIGKTTDEARLELEKYIDDAYIAHLPSVRIIHGRGTGALKNMVKDFCKKSSIIKEARFGDYYEGGDGATVITFT